MPSKKKRSRFSLLRDYKPAQWRESFLFIKDKFLKTKIACIILWDFYDEENKKCPYFIKKLSNNQKDIIIYHYNNTFGKGDFDSPLSRSPICE